MWGNISGSFYIDLQRAKVFNYDGAIKGPAFFSQPVLKILHERFGIMCSSFKLYCMLLLAHSTHLALWQAKRTKYDSVSTPLLTARYDPTQQPPIKNILCWHVPKKQNKTKANDLLLSSRKWLETDFQDLVRSQRATLASKTCRAAAMSSANGIFTVLKAWNGLCAPDEVFSMGVLCPGEDTAKCDIRSKYRF